MGCGGNTVEDGAGSSRELSLQKFAVACYAPPSCSFTPIIFKEICEALHYGLLTLGHDSIITSDLNQPDRRLIIFGGHLFAGDPLPEPLPADAILFNTEQASLKPRPWWMGADALRYFTAHTMFDYSLHNMHMMSYWGIRDIYHMPPGYVPELNRIPKGEEDIDVLYFGSTNQRRRKILDELKSYGVNVVELSGYFGEHRDKFIARAKILLNIHFYESRIFEAIRVCYLLANGRFIVSENGVDGAEESYYQDGIVFSNYQTLVEDCLKYLQLARAREAIAQRGLELIQARPQHELLAKVLSDMASGTP